MIMMNPKRKNALAGNCEFALMQYTLIPVSNYEEAQYVADYLANVLTNGKVTSVSGVKREDIQKLVKYVGFYFVENKPCIIFTVSPEFEEYNGLHYMNCFVSNLYIPEFSEYGDCFFKQHAQFKNLKCTIYPKDYFMYREGC